MSHYTQEDLILDSLRDHPEGLHPTYFIADLHIYQYSARINGLRKRFNCQCKNGFRCSANHHIINKRLPNGTTKFFYEESGSVMEKYRIETIEKRDAVPVNNSAQLSFL